MVIAPTATVNVFPFAMLTGAPFQSPNQQRTPALSVMSNDCTDHDEPDVFVHEIAEPAGHVTLEPADDAVDAVPNVLPPAV